MVRVEIVGLFDTSTHYSVALDRLEPARTGRNLATLYGQHPTSPVTLEFMIDSDRLRAGSYSLRVRKQASDEEALDFGFVKALSLSRVWRVVAESLSAAVTSVG